MTPALQEAVERLKATIPVFYDGTELMEGAKQWAEDLRLVLNALQDAERGGADLRAKLQPFAHLCEPSFDDEAPPRNGTVHLLLMGDGELGELPMRAFWEAHDALQSSPPSPSSVKSEGGETSATCQHEHLRFHSGCYHIGCLDCGGWWTADKGNNDWARDRYLRVTDRAIAATETQP